MHLLHSASQSTGDMFFSVMFDRSITPRQLAVLRAMDENEGRNQTELTGAHGHRSLDSLGHCSSPEALRLYRSPSSAEGHTCL